MRETRNYLMRSAGRMTNMNLRNDTRFTGVTCGQRTGKFRLETDKLITDAQGNSRISMEDAAIAIVDELESPRHERARFTAGY